VCSTNAQEEAKRVLVLGSTAHPRGVDCYSWFDWDEAPNVSDYDVVFLNLMGELPPVEERASRHLPRADLFDDLLDSHGEAFVLGLESCRHSDLVVHVSQALPCEVVFSAPTKVVTARLSPGYQTKYARFFEQVREADKWLVRLEPRPGRWERYRAGQVPLQHMSIARDRAGHVLAWQVAAGRQGLGLFFLPAPTECSGEQAVNILLEDILGIASGLRPPEWVDAYKAPGQQECERELVKAEGALGHAQQKVEDLREALVRVQRYRELLYGVSTQLEEIVHRTLEGLGATVEPEEPGGHDGRITGPTGRKAVLEIKGTRRTISLDNQRQLADWVARQVAKGTAFEKGILFGNPHCDLPLEQRTDPPFAEEAVVNAQRDDQSLITTRQLFLALKDFKAGKLKSQVFWNALFDGRGVVQLRGE